MLYAESQINDPRVAKANSMQREIEQISYNRNEIRYV